VVFRETHHCQPIFATRHQTTKHADHLCLLLLSALCLLCGEKSFLSFYSTPIPAVNPTPHQFPSSPIQRRINRSRRQSDIASIAVVSNQCPVQSLPKPHPKDPNPQNPLVFQESQKKSAAILQP
jgi:hypothetical protein